VQRQKASAAAKLSTEEKIDFKSEDENAANVATDIRIASDNISGGHTASPTKHKTLDLFKPSLQTLIDAAEGVTSAATETERRLAAKEITKLSSSNVINEKDINAARGKLRKIEEKFEKRTALSKESHEQFVANRRAEAAIANEIQNITYGIDTTEKVAVPELETALKIAKAKTRADLKATKVTADAAGTSNVAPRRVDTSKEAGKVVALSEDELSGG
jgi:membrane-associated HD superfamily phosphohydrolase